jgi:hypothetical protein
MAGLIAITPQAVKRTSIKQLKVGMQAALVVFLVQTFG